MHSREEAANRGATIAALAGGLAHHLSNLLATALMSVDLLAPGARAAEQRRLLAGLEESLRQAVALLGQLQALARGGAGEPIAFQLPSLLADAQRLLRAVLPSGVDVVTDYPPELPLLFGDPGPVHQLLLRLGLAAQEAAGDQGRVTFTARGAAPRFVVVEVAASGGAWRPPGEVEELLRGLGGAVEAAPEGTWRVYLPAAAPQAVSPCSTA